MSQFRNTADVLNEVLQKSGEPTNGNSPFQTVALTYLNKVHQAIIGGGSILNVNVDEPWVWARAKFPMIIELQPAFTTGSVTVGKGSNNIQFSIGPSISLENWHFQCLGKSTVYKITNHTAALTAAQLDSNFVDDSGVYNFRCMKLDYQIFPQFLYVDNYNDTINFQEVQTASNTTTTLVASVQHGSYTPSNYITQVIAQMNNVGTAGYTGSFDTIANTFAIQCNTAATTFNLLGASGANTNRSAMPTLGLDTLDYTAATAYTSSYVPNAVARMIEPFKLCVSNFWGEHFIYSTDPIKMQEDNPIQLTPQRYPDRFAHISEDNFGVNWVRMNAYPATATRVEINWVRVPVDLQNNTASFLKLPRNDMDAAIHGASAWVLYDKNSAKWESTLKLCSGQLDAMKKKNHDKLLRTGEYFGQIVPRQDLNRQTRRLQFGYTVNGSTAAVTTAFSTPLFSSAAITYAGFQTAATVASATFATMPQNTTLLNLIAQLTTTFTGASITSVKLNVGTSANPTQFINGFSLNQAASSTATYATVLNYFPGVITNLQAQIVATGANLSNLTAGAANIFFNEAQV